MRRFLALLMVGLFYLSTLSWGAEVRKLGSNDLSWGVYNTTWTSPGGKSVTYLPRYYDNNAWSDNLNLFGLSLTGDGTGSITGFNVPLYLSNFLSVHDALTHVTDVRYYGALVDGTTDDSEAFQDALDNVVAAGGGTVTITGTMGLGTTGWTGIALSAASNIRIVGVGPGAGIKILAAPSQTIFTGGGNKAVAIKFSNGSNNIVKGLDFDGNGIATAFLGFDTETDPYVEGNLFRDSTTLTWALQFASCYRDRTVANSFRDLGGYGVGTHAKTGGNSSRGAIVALNTFSNLGGDPIVFGSDYGIVSNNTIRDWGTTGSGSGLILVTNPTNAVTGATITGNTFQNGPWHGIQSDSGTEVSTYISVVGNTFDNVGTTANHSAIYLPYISDSTIAVNTIHGSTESNGIGGLAAIDNITVFGNTIHTVNGQAIRFTGESTYGVSNITISGNTAFSDNATPIAFYYSGGVGGTNQNINISGNIAISGSTYALWMWYGFTNITINNNILTSGGSQAEIRADDNTYTTYGAGNVHTGGFGVTGAAASGPTGVLVHSVQGKKIIHAAAAPTTGTWTEGDLVYNTAGNDNVLGWRCITAGTDNAVFKSMTITLEP